MLSSEHNGTGVQLTYELWFFDSSDDSEEGFNRLDPGPERQAQELRDNKPLDNRSEIPAWSRGVLYCMAGEPARCTEWTAWGFVEDCDVLTELRIVSAARGYVSEGMAVAIVGEVTPPMSQMSTVNC